MRHLKSFSPLNRTHSHRKALYKNMAEALFKNERIKTTKIKAKEIRRVAEKLITKAKVKSLHNIRIINKLIKDKDVLMKLFDDIAPRYVSRNGGYTRITKVARRKGDGAEMAYLELIEEQAGNAPKKKKKKVVVEEKQPTTPKATSEVKDDSAPKAAEDSKNVESKEEVKAEIKAEETSPGTEIVEEKDE